LDRRKIRAHGPRLRPHLARPLGQTQRATHRPRVFQLPLCRTLSQRQISRRKKTHLKVVATSSTGKTVTDEIDFTYQTAPWSKPTQLKLAQTNLTATTNTVEATLHDAAGNLCLDSRIPVRFSLAGPGILHDNLGTSSGSRLVQLYNGRAQITYTHANGPNTIAVTAEGITTASLTLT